MLLLSDRHVIYCKARYYSPETFRLRWYLDVENINNVLGTSSSICMTRATFADVRVGCFRIMGRVVCEVRIGVCVRVKLYNYTERDSKS